MTELTHELTAAAPARLLFDLVADVVEAPQYFATHLHAEIVRAESAERDLVARWVIDGGAPRGWRLWRVRDTENLLISFEHETPRPPLTAMRGEWRFERLADGGTRLRVRHSFEPAEGAGPAAADKVARQLDDNVPRQLAGIARLAGSIEALRRDTLTSVRTVRVQAPREEVAARAAGTLPDGAAHWVCVEPSEGRLVFKRHTELAPQLHASTGEFGFTEEQGGTTVRLRRTVTLTGPVPEEESRVARKQLDADVRDQLTELAGTAG
ncbi:SRPBCC family protein [Streptomyces sp. NRRL B-24085]|uniref:SRPBCC family protein n=1 Tax=Streptomyces sp. NRRL B-24085 TaxID=1709476 RepID=UPI0006B360A6|nr:SRPBCC family protein [Streptomyces sp. NRRL B-24085]